VTNISCILFWTMRICTISKHYTVKMEEWDGAVILLLQLEIMVSCVEAREIAYGTFINALTLFSYKERSPIWPPTMIHSNAFSIITWHLLTSRRHPLSTTWWRAMHLWIELKKHSQTQNSMCSNCSCPMMTYLILLFYIHPHVGYGCKE